MREETFNAAVDIARDCLRQEHENWGATSAEGMARLYRRRDPNTRVAFIRDLVWCSEEIAFAWDSLNLIARDLLRDGEQLPTELAEWVADRLDTNRPRPSRRGQDPDAKVNRNRAVMVAVRHLTRQGMTATRNKGGLNRACFEGGSACDAVGVAANLSYKTVESIWSESASPESPIYRFAFRYVPRLSSYSNPENK